MKKLATYGQIKQILKMTDSYDEADYLTHILKSFKKDTIFEITSKQASGAIKQITRWHKAHLAKSKKSKKSKKKKSKKQNKRIPYEDWTKKHKKYLQSKHWQDIKVRFKRDRCFICESIENLHLHHRNYNCLNKESDKDLVTLCAICHYEVHELAKNKSNKLTISSAVEYLKEKRTC